MPVPQENRDRDYELVLPPEVSTGSSDSASFSLEDRVGRQNYPVHILLFIATFITTTLAGTFWIGKWDTTESLAALKRNFSSGIPFSISLLVFLSFHEFGHFFACVKHRVKATLPYYIPMPPISFLLNIGTFGALIRIRERIPSSKSLFDIGVAGPLSGFVIALGLLIYGFATLPPIDFVYSVHPEYREIGMIPPPLPGTLIAGKNLLYIIVESMFAGPDVPPMHEMYHYPFLLAGWIGCFVTALNLLPVGQLDGGHVVHAMFGSKVHRVVARAFIALILILGMPTFIEWMVGFGAAFMEKDFAGLNYPDWVYMISWPSWIIWALILVKFIKIDHPPVLNEHPLDPKRRIVGWISIVVFILCFTPVPFTIL